MGAQSVATTRDDRDARQEAVRSAIGLLLDQFDLAGLLGVSLEQLRKWRHQGSGPPFVRIAQRPYYRPADVRAWIESLPAGQPGRRRVKDAT